MNAKGGKIDPKAIGKAFAERFKDLGQGKMSFEDMQDSIWEILQSNGIEIPEKVKQVIKEYQPHA